MKKRTFYGADGSPYLTRWTLLDLGRFGRICLHRFHRGDDDPDQHDHPWSFVTLILWGGYVEEFGADRRRRWRRPGFIGYRPANHRHRVEIEPGRETWSLLWIAADQRPDWGFYTATGFVHWRRYVAAREANRAIFQDSRYGNSEYSRGLS